MIRRFGKAPQNGQKYTRRPGVYAVLYRDGEMLVTRQFLPETMSAPEIQLPGGGIDPGENPITALHREVFEETGWSIGRPQRLGAFRRFTYMPEYDLWAEKLCTIYIARPVIQHGPPTEPEHKALWLHPADALARLYNDGDRFFTKQAMAFRNFVTL